MGVEQGLRSPCVPGDPTEPDEKERTWQFPRPCGKDSRELLRVICLFIYPQRQRFPKEPDGGLAISDFRERASKMW